MLFLGVLQYSQEKTRVFSYEYCETLKNAYFEKHLISCFFKRPKWKSQDSKGFDEVGGSGGGGGRDGGGVFLGHSVIMIKLTLGFFSSKFAIWAPYN